MGLPLKTASAWVRSKPVERSFSLFLAVEEKPLKWSLQTSDRTILQSYYVPKSSSFVLLYLEIFKSRLERKSMTKTTLPMRADLVVGSKFPDFELPDQTGTLRTLSSLLEGFPAALIFSRGYY